MRQHGQIAAGEAFRSPTELRPHRQAGLVPPSPDSMIEAPRRRHSQKPDQVYELLELFARQARPGWVAWGKEAPADRGGK